MPIRDLMEMQLAVSVAEIAVGNYTEPVQMVEPHVRTRFIMDYFEQDPGAHCVIVVEEDRPVGMIVREKMFSRLGRGYGQSVYLNRPAKLIMSDLFLQADHEQSVESVSRLATRRESSRLYDGVVITREERCVGIVSVKTLLDLTTGNQIEVVRGQARVLGLTSGMISHIADRARSIEESSRETEEIAQGMQKRARQGDSAMEATLAMIQFMEDAVQRQEQIISRLGELSLSIAPLSETIRNVAEQTHMLALNASIEAARAGSEGRGFGVVADEVKKLADRTTHAAGNIDEVVGEILGQIERVVGTSRTLGSRAKESREAGTGAREELARIGDSVRSTLEHMEGVFQLADEIASSSRHLHDVVSYLAEQARGMTGE